MTETLKDNERRIEYWEKQINKVLPQLYDFGGRSGTEIRLHEYLRRMIVVVLAGDEDVEPEWSALKGIVEDLAFWNKLEEVRKELNP